MSDVYLYSLADGKNHRVTEGRYASDLAELLRRRQISVLRLRPRLQPDLQRHRMEPRLSRYGEDLCRHSREEDPVPVPHPRRGGAAKKKDAKKEAVKPGAERKADPTEVKVDIEGIDERILQLPVKPANYRNLQSVGSARLLHPPGRRRSPSRSSSHSISEARKETALGSVGGFEISADGKKMIVSQDGKYGIIDLPKGPVTISSPLDLSGMEMQLDRSAEWKQIFHECWRQMRDFFYDPDMHGVDWLSMRARYEPLVSHVNHRADLTYVIGEMIGELNVGHAYVGGGDMPQAGPRAARPARRQTAKGSEDGICPDRQDPQGIALGEQTALSAARTGRRGEGRRLDRRDRRQADQRDDEHLRRRWSTRSASR